MSSIQVIKENSLGINRGLYGESFGNALSAGNITTLMAEGAAVNVGTDAYSTTASIGGGGKYWGCVAQGKWPSFATTASSFRYINQMISDLLYDDIEAIQFVWTRDYGFNETPAGTTSTIEQSILKRDGSRMRVTFGGSNQGVIPISGYLFSDIMPLGETRKTGELLTHFSFISADSATGTCGVSRNVAVSYPVSKTNASFVQPAVNAALAVTVTDSSYLNVGQNYRVGALGLYELTAIGSSTSITLRNLGTEGAAAVGDTVANSSNITIESKNAFATFADGQTPINSVDSGIPSNGSTAALRPVAILGYTSKPTYGLIGDSLNGEDGGSFYQTDGVGYGGLLGRWLSTRAAGINMSYPGQNYGHTITQRSQLKNYFTAIVDGMGINDPSLTVKSLKTNMANYASAFGTDKAYVKATYTPYTTSTDFFATLANQTKQAARDLHRLACNPAIRSYVSPIDAYIDVSEAVSSGMDSGLWKPNPASTISVNTVVSPFSSGNTQLTATTGAPFTTEYLGKVVGIPNGANLTSGIIYAVSSDGTKALCIRGPANTQSAVPLYVDITVYDGIHPGLVSELSVKNNANKTTVPQILMK